MDVELSITQPKEFELNPIITKDIKLYHNQSDAFKDVDFVYAKKINDHSIEVKYNGKAGLDKQQKLKESMIANLINFIVGLSTSTISFL